MPDADGYRRQQSREQMRKLLVHIDEDAAIGDEPHWTCPNCGIVCMCVGLARLAPHEPCGRSHGD